MRFTVSQYLESVLNSRGLTRTLGEIDVCRTADGSPVFHTGNSSVVFRIRLGGRDRLLKCYTRPQPHLRAIYGERFRPAELFLYTSPSEGVWTDIVVDDWIEGESLTRTLDRAAAEADGALIARLADAFDTLAAHLLPAEWAHGDLKPDNLIWDGQRLRPIDFDAMFLPEFRGCRSPELGTRAFQHPSRTEADFDAALDDYPAALIATVLHAAAHDPTLLARHPAEGLVLDPQAVVEGRSEAYREILDGMARRGDAVGYRTAQLLRSPALRIPQAAPLFAWRLQRAEPTAIPPELAVCDGRWGFRAGGRFVLPPVWDNGFDFSEGLAAVALAGRWHFIDTAGRTVLHCPPCDAVKPFRNGTAELQCGTRRVKIAHPLKNSS